MATCVRRVIAACNVGFLLGLARLDGVRGERHPDARGRFRGLRI